MATLRRTERSRACAGSSGGTLRRVWNEIADELIGSWTLQPGPAVTARPGCGHVGARIGLAAPHITAASTVTRAVPAVRGDLHLVPSCGLSRCARTHKGVLHMSAERPVLIHPSLVVRAPSAS